MTVETTDCFDGGGKLERPRYFDNQLLAADDLLAEQEYFRHRLMRHNRFLHGWGVVCGLVVAADPTDELPWRIRIEPGYALGPIGHEIHVPQATFLDLALCGPGATTDPCDPALLRSPAQASGPVYVAIRYAECVSRPLRVLPDGCACVEETCEFSRVRSSFEITCLPELPPSHEPPPSGPLLCDVAQRLALVPCPPCPSDPWVVLACVDLTGSSDSPLAADAIDNFSFRRQVFSTSVLQEQIIECCCRQTPSSSADLGVIKESVASFHNVVYTIMVTNLGPATAQDLRVIDVLELDNFPLEQAGNFSGFHSTHGGVWTPVVISGNMAQSEAVISSLPAGEVATLGFNAQFVSQVPIRETVMNTASISSVTHDPDLSNNQDQTTDRLDGDQS